jgi:hypothetical protein
VCFVSSCDWLKVESHFNQSGDTLHLSGPEGH